MANIYWNECLSTALQFIKMAQTVKNIYPSYVLCNDLGSTIKIYERYVVGIICLGIEGILDTTGIDHGFEHVHVREEWVMSEEGGFPNPLVSFR